MANVVRNPDNTATVTFTGAEQRVLVRWAADHNRSVAQQLEETINGFLQNKRADYQGADGPTMRAQYEALSPAKQAEVDAILNGPSAAIAGGREGVAQRGPSRTRREDRG